MKLAVIANTAHHIDEQGQLHALEPVVAQLDQLFSIFDHVTICAPLHEGPPPAGFAPYRSAHLRLRAVRPGGGATIRAKIGLTARTAEWWRASREVARDAEALHFRCPSNVAGVGIVATWRWTRHRYAMYAGTWAGYEGEPVTYKLQRWVLRRLPKPSVVTVYGKRSSDPDHVFDFYSPSYTDTDWQEESEFVRMKLERLQHCEELRTVHIVSVGSLNKNKGHDLIVRAVSEMMTSGIEATLQIVGRGPEEKTLQQMIDELGLTRVVSLTGHIPLTQVRELLRKADFALVASRAEGFGKVVLEAMLSGAVPVMTPVGVARSITGDGVRGLVVERTPAAFARAVRDLAATPSRMASMVVEGRAYSRVRTVEAFGEHLESLFVNW